FQYALEWSLRSAPGHSFIAICHLLKTLKTAA
ncbi:MAG: hypothetical protein ACI87W_003664, partial [Halieaceae bacterium]